MKSILMILLPLLIIFLLLVKSCSKPESYLELRHVKRVMAHDSEFYTVWYSDSADSIDLKPYDAAYDCETQIYIDVPEHEDMWLTAHRKGHFPFRKCKVTIHLHSADEIGGMLRR